MTHTSYIRELCVALEHRWKPERLFVIFTAYLDESGTHQGAPALIMAAYLGTARQWELVERKLRAIQREHGFSVFHAKDFRKKSGEFRGWSDERRGRLLMAILGLVRSHLTAGVSIALPTERYEREFRDAPRPKKMPPQSQFGICFRNVLSHLIRKVEAERGNHRLNIVMEGGHKNEGAAYVIFNEIKDELEEDFGSHLLGTITIARKQDSAPLMLADFLAYIAFSADQDARANAAKPPDPLSPNDALWNDHITLAPNAFERSVQQFEEGRRRKALKRRNRDD